MEEKSYEKFAQISVHILIHHRLRCGPPSKATTQKGLDPSVLHGTQEEMEHFSGVEIGNHMPRRELNELVASLNLDAIGAQGQSFGREIALNNSSVYKLVIRSIEIPFQTAKAFLQHMVEQGWEQYNLAGLTGVVGEEKDSTEESSNQIRLFEEAGRGLVLSLEPKTEQDPALLGTFDVVPR